MKFQSPIAAVTLATVALMSPVSAFMGQCAADQAAIYAQEGTFVRYYCPSVLTQLAFNELQLWVEKKITISSVKELATCGTAPCLNAIQHATSVMPNCVMASSYNPAVWYNSLFSLCNALASITSPVEADGPDGVRPPTGNGGLGPSGNSSPHPSGNGGPPSNENRTPHPTGNGTPLPNGTPPPKPPANGNGNHHPQMKMANDPKENKVVVLRVRVRAKNTPNLRA